MVRVLVDFQICSQLLWQQLALQWSNGQALEGAEATKEAAIESEAEFSGVNFDSEARSIEFQQAYQASARVLSTARELFQTLIEAV